MVWEEGAREGSPYPDCVRFTRHKAQGLQPLGFGDGNPWALEAVDA